MGLPSGMMVVEILHCGSNNEPILGLGYWAKWARHWWGGRNQSCWGFLDGNSTGEVEGNSSLRGVKVAHAIVPSQG